MLPTIGKQPTDQPECRQRESERLRYARIAIDDQPAPRRHRERNQRRTRKLPPRRFVPWRRFRISIMRVGFHNSQVGLGTYRDLMEMSRAIIF